jgi:hypothetical protein
MEILKVAILDFCKRRRQSSFCPSEVVRKMYPEDWRLFMPDIQKAMMELYQQKTILITQSGQPVAPEGVPVGPVRISSFEKLS